MALLAPGDPAPDIEARQADGSPLQPARHAAEVLSAVREHGG